MIFDLPVLSLVVLSPEEVPEGLRVERRTTGDVGSGGGDNEFSYKDIYPPTHFWLTG
jgi:hypothetical protein